MASSTHGTPIIVEYTTSGIDTTDSAQEDSNGGITTEIIIYIAVGIFGVLANGFAVTVIATNKKMRQKVCNFFILNQGIIDFLGSFFLMVNNPALVSQKQPASWSAAQFYCRFWASSYFMWAMFEMSTFNLVGITIERYVEVVHPLSYHEIFSRKRAQIALASTWFIGIAFPMLPNVVPSPPGPEGICLRYGGWPNVALAKAMGVTIFIVMFIAPLIVMIFCYSKMVIVIKTRVNPMIEGNMSAAEKAREARRIKARQNLIKTLINVCVAFFVCWALNSIYYFLTTLGLELRFTNTFYYITVYLAFINCVVNPVIYTAQYREFQSAVKAKIPCFFQSANEDKANTATGNNT